MAQSSPVSIALVDHHPLQSAGILAVLRECPGFAVVAVGRTASDVIDIALRQRPNVMIVDLNMVDDTFNAIAKARSSVPETRIITFTSLANVKSVVRSLEAGTNGYILNTSEAAGLVDAVKAVSRGETYIAPSLSNQVITLLSSHSFKQVAEAVKFSVREEQVVRLLLRGLTNKEIGVTIRVSERTVKHYMTILMQKLKVRSRVECVIAAQRLAEGGAEFGANRFN